MNFKFLEVKDSNLLNKVFLFRYTVFFEIFPEYIKSSCFSDYKEHDKYDPYSVHFVALNDKDEICATVRLIHNSPVGYPTENGMKFDTDVYERDKLGEISRIFIDAKYRSIQTTKIIIQEMKKLLYVKMVELGVEYSYGALEKSFIRLLKIYKMSYLTITPEQEYSCFGLRYPCILYTEQLALDNPEFTKS